MLIVPVQRSLELTISLKELVVTLPGGWGVGGGAGSQQSSILGRSALRSNPLKGQCPDYAHARASSVLSSKDNRTVILTRQDFFPDHTAD